MINAFSGIIDSSFKTVFNNAISAILDDSSLTIACTLEYGVTKYDNCVNCIYDAIGLKSANRYQDGGPAPFPFGGICPLCNGNGRKPVTSSENVNLAVIFEPRQFLDNKSPQELVNEDNMDKVWDLLRFIEIGEADIWENETSTAN